MAGDARLAEPTYSGTMAVIVKAAPDDGMQRNEVASLKFLRTGGGMLAQQPSSTDVNAANNPLTPEITVNFHDQWAPELDPSERSRS
jgi:hypothetical protein